MVFPIGSAPDGNNGIAWSNAKDLYDKVNGNESRFLNLWSGSPDPKEKFANEYTASQIFGFLKSMDTDGKAGLSPEEYKAGLTEKKEDLEIKINNDWQQFSNYSDLDEFLKLSPTEQLASIKDWMLDLGIVTDILEADMEAMNWLEEWNRDRRNLAAINNKLDELDRQVSDGTEPTPSGGMRASYEAMKELHTERTEIQRRALDIARQQREINNTITERKNDIKNIQNIKPRTLTQTDETPFRD